MKNKQTIVIKIGTSSLTKEDGKVKEEVIQQICKITTALQKDDKNVIIVSSGAIGAGLNQLQITSRDNDLSIKQAAAAVGQAALMQIYETYFKSYDQICAQILLTNDVITNAVKRENVVRTIQTLHSLNVIPIVNENDSVSIAEIDDIAFSDNDTLSAIVSTLVNAQLLVIFSDVDGLYYKKDGKLTKEVIPYIDKISKQIVSNVSSEKSELGRGGMATKLKAIKTASKQGVDVILTNISTFEQLPVFIDSKNIGTFFKGAV